MVKTQAIYQLSQIYWSGKKNDNYGEDQEQSMPKKLPMEDVKLKACEAAAATQTPAKKTCLHQTMQTPFQSLDQETTYIVDKMVWMLWNKGSREYCHLCAGFQQCKSFVEMCTVRYCPLWHPKHCPMGTVPLVLVWRTASPAHTDFGGLSSRAAHIII
jgi:hypothetical protein